MAGKDPGYTEYSDEEKSGKDTKPKKRDYITDDSELEEDGSIIDDEEDVDVDDDSEVDTDVDDDDDDYNSGDDVYVDPVKEAEEAKARAGGWVPKDEWKGDPDDWKPAKYFNEVGEFFSTMKQQNATIQNLQKQLDEMAKFQTAAVKAERAKVYKELEAQKIEALQDADYEKVARIDEEIMNRKTSDLVEDTAKAEKKTPAKTDEEPQPTPEDTAAMESFLANNKWYQSDAELTDYADVVGLGFRAKNPNVTAAEVFKYAENAVKKAFPEKFGKSKNRSPVSGTKNRSNTGASSNKGGKYSRHDLNEIQKEVGKRFVQSGAFKNLDAYAAELGKMGELD